jgi:hypothetical protein
MKKILFATVVLFLGTTQVKSGVYINLKTLSPMVKLAHDAEKKHGIPENLLTAIAHVESKCSPWAVNARGQGYYFRSKEEAVAFIQKLISEGTTDINIGYMQLHYPSHKNKFSSVADMIDLSKNIEYAASLLKRLHAVYGSWERAVERYKSDFCDSSRHYQRKVYGFLASVYIPKNIAEHEPNSKKIGFSINKNSLGWATHATSQFITTSLKWKGSFKQSIINSVDAFKNEKSCFKNLTSLIKTTTQEKTSFGISRVKKMLSPMESKENTEHRLNKETVNSPFQFIFSPIVEIKSIILEIKGYTPCVA